MTTPQEVAQWMAEQLVHQVYLYPEDVVGDLREQLGEQFVYQTASGYPAISRAVLRAFRKLTANTVVWEQSGRSWRKRAGYDRPGRHAD